MKKFLTMFVILTTFSFGLTTECEKATIHAVEVHVKYMDDKATLTDSYNAENKMKKICGDKS